MSEANYILKKFHGDFKHLQTSDSAFKIPYIFCNGHKGGGGGLVFYSV